MRRILLIARRDYLASLRSKAFLFSLIGTPLFAGLAFLGIGITKAKPDIAERHVAIVDRTGAAAAAIIQAAAEENAKDMFERISGRQVEPHYIFETVPPDDADPAAQRLALSDRVRRHELAAFLEIGRNALQPAKPKDDQDAEKIPAADRVDYYSNAGALDETRRFLSGPINEGLRRVRLAQLGIDPARFADVLGSARIRSMNLISRDVKTGRIRGARKKGDIETFAVPYAMMMLLAMIVMVSSTPMLGAVSDDKRQRVFEMLLASASPLDLMAGKIAAGVALSLTGSVFYLAAAILALAMLTTLGLAPLALLPWFFVYLVAEVMVECALAVGVGSACESPMEAQHLVIILILPIMLPIFLLMPVMQQPNGALATALSFFPPFTPLLMLLRQALPGGVPAWQPWVGLIGVALWTILGAIAAARIFRIAILTQGKTPKLSELARWALNG